MLKNETSMATRLLSGDPLANLLFLAQRQRTFWGFDSEFLASGRVNHPEDVHTIQFSDGTNSVVLESADALKTWLYNHNRIQTVYGFVILPDLGSVEEWLGEGHVKIWTRGSQTVGRICYRSFKATVYDCRPLLQSFGVRRLADAGEIIGYPKLPKPDWLGLRKYETQEERQAFIKYAEADAVITSRIVQWLYHSFQADPQTHASAGTLARDIFNLPARLPRRKKTVQLSPLETLVRRSCFAGRSEGFRTGYMRNVFYNDVSSLYPLSICASHVLEIIGAEPCNPSNLNAENPLESLNYGWLEGTFQTENDLWGVPLRGKNNFYATGTITGFYHTLDLVAAKAKTLHVAHAYKPIFKKTPIHDKFVKLTLDRIEGRLKGTEKMFAKAVLNSLSGKLGQSHPISRTSNFYAYASLLAHSHAVMSRLFDKCDSVLAMDTDSVFSFSNMSKKWFELNEGENSMPVIMDVKGEGDLSFFRSKNYILKTKEDSYVFGRHGWVYWLEDFLKLNDGRITELQTRQDIKATLLTRVKEAQELAKGRWRTKPVTLSLEKLKDLLKADTKRKRTEYDSYGLVMAKHSEPSRAWNYDELMLETENTIGYPKRE